MRLSGHKGRTTTKGSTNGHGKGFTNGSGKGMTNGLGRTNGLTNGAGRGRTNGLTNGAGRGMTNGVGRTNGLTNGAGRTNGLTNGLGRTNGLTNGQGKTNGLTNGLGRTNGMTNGLGGARYDRQGAVQPRKLSVIVVVVLLIILPVSLILLGNSQTVPGKLISVNGKFNDWDKMTKYTDTAMCADPVLDITEFAIAFDGTDIFAFVRTQGNMLSRATVDRYFAFIDADGSASTGYATMGMGAEYVVEACGYNAGGWQVSSSKFFGADQSNWSAFGNIGSGHAESQDTEMELKASLDMELDVGSALRVRFASMTGSAMADVCAPIVDGENGALVITQTSQDAAGIVATDSLMSLQLRAVGKDVAVSSLTIASQGVAATTQGGFAAGTIAVNTAMTVLVTGGVAALANGTLVKAGVSSATVATATYNVNGNPLAAYAHAAPSAIAIDGAFADWAPITKSSDAAGDVANANIDIVENAAAAQSNSFFAYVRFNGAGKAMSGMAVPSVRVVPTGGGGGGGGGGTTVLPRVAGEDLTRIYVDSKAGGSAIGGIAADYMIELRGKNGAISSKRLMTWPGMALVGAISAEAGAGAIEASAPLGLIGSPNGTIRFYVETTDWEKKVDTTTGMTFLASLGTRSEGDEPTPEDFGTAVVFDSVDSTSISTVFDSVNNMVVIAYHDNTANLGKAVVGTVGSGNTITYGTPVTFLSGGSNYGGAISAVFDSNSGNVVVAYTDWRASTQNGVAIVGTVSGTGASATITFGTAVTFNSGDTYGVAATYDSSTSNVVVGYLDGSFNGKGIVGTPSGTGASATIVFGTTPVIFDTGVQRLTATFDSVANKVVFAYYDNSNGMVSVGTVSGSGMTGTIAFGDTPVTFHAGSPYYIATTFDSSTGKVVIAYSPSGSYIGTVRVGTVSGSGTGQTITFGDTPVIFNSGSTSYMSIAYDSSYSKIVIAYWNFIDMGYADSYFGTVRVGTVSGSGAGQTIAFGGPQVFITENTAQVISITYTSTSNRVFIAYKDYNAGGHGTGVVMNDTPEFSTVAIPIAFFAVPFIVYRAKRRKPINGGD